MNLKRRLGISILLVSMVLVCSIMIGVNAQPVESTTTPYYMPDPSNWTWTGYGSEEAWYQIWNNKANMVGFYSNYSNMFYWFGDMGINAITHISTTHHTIGYAVSPDGVNWFVNRTFGRQTAQSDSYIYDIDVRAEGRFDVVLETNGRYFWVVTISQYHNEPYPIYAIRGEINATTGKVRWAGTIQTVHSGLVEGSKKTIDPIDAEVDSNGRLFVAFNGYLGGPIYIGYVTWTNRTDGGWTTEGLDAYDSLLSWNKGDSVKEYLKLNRLAEGKMALTGIFDSGGGNVWYVETLYFNGISWIAFQEKRMFASAAAETVMWKKVDIVSYGDNLVAAYTRRNVGFQKLFVEDAVYNSGWTNQTILKGDYPEMTGLYVPHLTATWEGNIMLFLHESNGNTMNYTYRFSNYTWHLPIIENFLNDSWADYGWRLITFMDTTQDIIPIWYQDGYDAWTEMNFHYFLWEADELPLVFEYFNTTLEIEIDGVTLYGSDGTPYEGTTGEPFRNGDWLFEGDIYTFETYVYGVEQFYLHFTDGQHDILFRFNNITGEMYVASGERFVVGDIYTNSIINGSGVQHLIWRFILDVNIVDVVNTSVTYWYSTPLGFSNVGYTNITFNIYNLGGLTAYVFNGDGNRTRFGSPFEVYATNGSLGSTARAEQIFRKLQHVSFLIELDMNNEWDVGNGEFDIDGGWGYYDIGIDYRLNSTWIEGFKIRIYVQSADVGHHDGGNDHNWVEWSIDFYNYDPNTGSVQNLQSQLIYSNHWGYEHENYVPDYHNRTSSQLWVDLWFDKTNASTTVGAQVNSYYYGNKEQGSAWWFGYGVFTPMISEYDNAKFLDDLYDNEGNVTNVQKFDLMKFYIEVGKVDIADGNDETFKVAQVEDMHRELAIDRMMGIDEPTFVQTKIIDMPQTGFINAIKSAINGLSKLIWSGALQFLKILMGAVGSLMDAIGLGEWWIAFNLVLSNVSEFSLALMDDFIIALTNTSLLLTQVFNLVSTTIGKVVTVITGTVSNLLQWYGFMVDMIMGGGIFTTDFWTLLSLGDWALLFINLAPIWWINRLGNADDLGETLKGDIQFMAFIVSGLLNFLITIVMLSITILNLLLGLLPI